MGSLVPRVVWRMVIIPDMKTRVEMMLALSGSSESMQRAGVRMTGQATVAPIISR